jgi:hypothetical protein
LDDAKWVCDALPVAYFQHSVNHWTKFAQLILDASYEATLCVAILNAVHTGSQQVFLTLLGGGAFGNKTDWILSAIQRALIQVAQVNLQVSIVSYGKSNPAVQTLIQQF